MKTLWFTLGFALAMVIVGVLALWPLLNSRAGERTLHLPSPSSPMISPTERFPEKVTPSPPPTPWPTPTPSPSPMPSGLAWQRLMTLNGRCERLEIDAQNAAHYAPCDEGSRLAYLTQEELNTYSIWLQRYTPFDYGVQTPGQLGGHDTVQLHFGGQGKEQPSPAAQAEMAAWAGEVYERLREEEIRADLLALARLDLAGRRGLATDAIVTVSVEAVTWPDACLGIAIEGLFCAQVQTPGYRIVLRADDALYEYHTDQHDVVRQVPQTSPRSSAP